MQADEQHCIGLMISKVPALKKVVIKMIILEIYVWYILSPYSEGITQLAPGLHAEPGQLLTDIYSSYDHFLQVVSLPSLPP